MRLRSTLINALPVIACAVLLTPIIAAADPSGAFSVTGTGGTETSDPSSTNPSGQGCQFGGTCVVDTTGTANVMANTVSFPATYSSKLSINYAQVQLVGNQYCAPATGTVNITSTSNQADTIAKSEQGQVCANNAPGAPHSFSGTFTITGGTGQFNGATGSGSSTLQDDGANKVTSSQESGNISVPPPSNVAEVPAAVMLPALGAALVVGGTVWRRRSLRSA